MSKKSGSSTSSVGPGDSGSDSNRPINIVESALIHSRGLETRKDEVSHSLKGAGGGSSKNFVVSGTTTSTDMQLKHTTESSMKATSRQTSQRSRQMTFLNTTFSARDSLARLFRSLGRGAGSRIPGERCFLRLRESSGIRDPR